MSRGILEARTVIALATAAVVGGGGLGMYPVQFGNPFLGLIALEKPFVFRVLTYRHSTVLVHEAFFAASLAMSVVAIMPTGSTDIGRDPAARATTPSHRGRTRHDAT